MHYKSGRSDIKCLNKQDVLFLTFSSLRHGFGLKDLATRFDLSTQSTSILFSAWLDFMYFKICQLNIWPHRNTIIENIPTAFKKDFPPLLLSLMEQR